MLRAADRGWHAYAVAPAACGGVLVLARPQPTAARTLSLLGVDQVIPAAGDQHDATPVTLRRAMAFVEANPDIDISVADIASAAQPGTGIATPPFG